jgi:phage shock protein PspC (stress-responsive transcriptional regulator)
MDEDAYQLLDKYLNNIRIYFRREEGVSEIIADFEARIEELFSERIRLGYEVVTIGQVEEVISRVGKPTDFGDDESDSRGRDEESGRDEKQTFQQSGQQSYRQVKKTFFRNNDNKMLGGVCSGLAAYFGWDALAVRIIAIILMFASSFAVVPIYLLAWIIIPAAKTASEKLQMQGMPITVENIGKTVAAEAELSGKRENKGCMEGFIEAIVALMKICLVGIGCLIGLPMIFVFAIIIIVLFAVLFGVGGGLLEALPFGLGGDASFLTFEHPVLATTAFIFVAGIPLVVLIYSIVAGIAKFTPVNKSVKWIIFAVWIVALMLLFGSGLRVNKDFVSSDWEFRVNDIDGGIYTEQEYLIDQPFEHVDLDDDLICNIQIEQTAAAPTSIKVEGGENLVKYFRYEVTDGRLRLFAPEWKRFSIGKKYSSQFEEINIKLNVANIKGINSNSIGKVLLPGAFSSENLQIKLNGIGKFQADSLYVKFLKADADGVGSLVLRGQAGKAEFDMGGTGLINALELVADSVYAKVDGIGAVKCNPVIYLKGKVNGIGSLTYKQEPKKKNTEVSGLGIIKKEK